MSRMISHGWRCSRRGVSNVTRSTGYCCGCFWHTHWKLWILARDNNTIAITRPSQFDLCSFDSHDVSRATRSDTEDHTLPDSEPSSTKVLSYREFFASVDNTRITILEVAKSMQRYQCDVLLYVTSSDFLLFHYIYNQLHDNR
jgi:hypothetical protein